MCVCVCVCVCVCTCTCSVAQSCPTLCNTMDCNLPGFLSMGVSRQEYLSELPFPTPGDLSDPGIKPAPPALAGRFFTTERPGNPQSSSKRDRS